jgi:hypothetical protein
VGFCHPPGNTSRGWVWLGGGAPPPPPPAPTPDPIVHNNRIAGTWQITNMWSLNLGEVGQLGAVEIEITQPDEKKFKMKGYGAGFGVSVDPISYVKALKNLSNLLPGKDPVQLAKVVESLLKGVGFNIGDYLQIFTKALGPLSVTGGRIIPNPVNASRGRPTAVSRYMLAGGGSGMRPFMIGSLGGGVGAGMEGGIVFFDTLPGPGILDAAAIGVYGSAGVTVKFGAGAQVMYYSNGGSVDA